LPGALQEHHFSQQLGTTQHSQEGQQWAEEGWLLHAFLLSWIWLQKLEQAGIPMRREARRQLVGAFTGVTEAVTYL